MNAGHRHRKTSTLFSSNLRHAHRIWGSLSKDNLANLKRLSEIYSIEVATSDVQLLGGRWYVTHAGLLRIAHRHNCAGIKTILLKEFSSPAEKRWVFKATVYTSSRSRGFVGYGDADPSNVSPLVRGAEMRVAETRAVNRALRKAYGIGLCSAEELGWEPKNYAPPNAQKQPSAPSSNGQNSHPRLRDRLCLLIRQHQLDANLVKAYAADSCGTPNLRDATRDQIETFINNLSDWATKDRPALLCKLNSYSRAQEVTS
jgi:hypothetical protein